MRNGVLEVLYMGTIDHEYDVSGGHLTILLSSKPRLGIFMESTGKKGSYLELHSLEFYVSSFTLHHSSY